MKKRKMKTSTVWKKIKICLPARRLMLLMIILVSLETCFTLIFPLLSKKYVDTLNIESIKKETFLMIGLLFLVQLFLSSISLYYTNCVSQKILQKLRNLVWEKVLYLPVEYYDKNPMGDTVSKLTNDTLSVKNFISEDIIPFVTSLFTLFGAIVILFFLDLKIALLMTTLIPSVVFCVCLFGSKEYDVSAALQEEMALFQSVVTRTLSDIRLVKYSIAENKEIIEGNDIIERMYQLGIKEGRLFSLIQPFNSSAQLLLLVIIFAYGSLRVGQGTLSSGTLVAVVFYVFQIASPCAVISMFYAKYQKFLSSMERISSILDIENEISTIDEKISIPLKKDVIKAGTLKFSNLCFGYSKDKIALRNINFDIEKGTTTAIVGLSGAGKTTLFSLLERFYEPLAGDILYNNKSIYQYNIREWRAKISYVAQDTPIMLGNIISNLTYGVEEYSFDQVEKAIEDVNLTEFINSLPQKYETEVGDRGIKLSGGQKQRIAIARAIIRNPEILLLDEATAHLDSLSEKMVQQSLEKLMTNRTTIIVAHRLATIKNADKIIILNQGEIIGSGSHIQLLQSNDLYKKLVKQQVV